ncbi:MAG: winged helix-turn-helix transcriptional regulator [Solirubrobacterales bacterium]|nr:winged helix-turn-helix transcriptional regulator [Solirubrobacterales bacterium]
MAADPYRTLADPTRRQILRLLRERDLPAGVIAEQFEISWPSVSRHLGLLASAGLVRPTRRGQQLIYSLNRPALVSIAAELVDLAGIRERPRRTSRAQRAAARLRPRPRQEPT